MKTSQLVAIFESLKGTGKAIRFGALMCKGFSSPIILHAMEKVGGLSLANDTEGYSIIKF